MDMKKMLKRWARPHGQSGTALSRQFALLSLGVIGLITLTLSMVIVYSLRGDLLEREWGITADFIRTEAHQVLAPSDFAAPTTPAAQAHFERFYQQTGMMPEIVRVKIYDTNTGVIWSDEPRLEGERFPDNPQLVQALSGQTTVNLDTDELKRENVYERNEFAQLVEVYVPIVFPDTSRIVGVVETYKTPNQVFASIRKGQLTVIGTSLLGGAFLYLSLFWIVRRAGRRIEDQHTALEQRTQELILANEELRAVQAQLLEAERLAAIGEVVTAVAHGIRNPLANIRAAAQVASLESRDAGASTLVPKSLINIMLEVDRLEGRLKELLQFVRPASRPSEPLDLNSVLRESLRMVEGRIAKTHLKVEAKLAEGLPQMMGSAILLEQVFLGLIGNAIEAIPDGAGSITVLSGRDVDGTGVPSIFVEIRDTGVGIPAEQLSRIFEPFYTTKAQGTGLGLAIAKKFAEAHGGALTVRSRPGEGTAFRVTFPDFLEA
jgi:two-component system, NtrC family, sensor histidine kinase HydH